MGKIAVGLTIWVAVLQTIFMGLEIFGWNLPVMRNLSHLRTIGNVDVHIEAWTLAKNQGLYNGFLAAGLFYGLFLAEGGTRMVEFSLVCVFVAGIFGAFTVDSKLLGAQTLPAALALAAIWRGW